VSAAEERLSNDPTSALWGEHRARYRFALSLAQASWRQGVVLDVASGAGFGLAMLSEAGYRTVGVDYDLPSLTQARSVAASARLVNGDATRLSFGDAVFDAVLSFETLEHVPDARAMVRELRRVLRPGGRLILSTPNRAFGPPSLHENNPFHVQEFTAPELRTLLEVSFETVQLYGQRPSADYRYVPFLMVERHLEPSAVAWKLQARLPYALRNRLALALSGRPFYPAETDYRFLLNDWGAAHALLAVAC
jgi:ubiquinone/menaquinone biosynthesis C-methylase UbiE